MAVGTSLRRATPKVRYRLPAAVRSAAGRYRRPEELSPSQFRGQIEAQMPPQMDEVPLADQILRNDRTRALVRSRLDRLTPEQQMRSLPGIEQGYQDFLAAKRAEEIARQRAAGKAVTDYGPLAGAAAALGIYAANELLEEPPEEEIDSFNPNLDLATYGELRQRDPADVIPEFLMDSVARDESMGDFYDLSNAAMESVDREAAVSPEVIIDDDLADGMEELLALQAAAEEDQLFFDEGIAEFDPEMPGIAPVASDVAIRPDDDLTLSRQSASRDQYMTDAQRRTVQALMNSGIPEQRAGRIARGEASLTMDEYRNLTGGRR